MNREVERVKGNTLDLEWQFNGIPENHAIVNALLYFNVTSPDTKAVISTWVADAKSPVVSRTGRNLFGSRISVSYTSDIYKLRIIQSQYNDTGLYFLQAEVGPVGLGNNVVKSSIISAKVKGK